MKNVDEDDPSSWDQEEEKMMLNVMTIIFSKVNDDRYKREKSANSNHWPSGGHQMSVRYAARSTWGKTDSYVSYSTLFASRSVKNLRSLQ